jgi:pimeloyl-ACP methyl ester carboxylesterase
MSDFAWVSWRAADGTPLWARDYPAAIDSGRAPVVCLHGLTRNSRDFEVVAPWIAGTGRRVLAADIRGRGRSGYAADAATYQPAVYAGDTLAMLDALGVDRPVVIGTSLGGLVAMVLAVMAPQRLAGAVLNDVGPVLAAEGLARIAGYAGQSAGVRDWAGARSYARVTNATAFPDYDDAEWDAVARRLFREGEAGPELDYDPRIMEPLRAAAEAGGPPPDLWPLFAQLASGDRPLLLLRGARSDLFDAATAAVMRELAPHMAYAEVPGVGHAPMLSEPAARAALDRFLQAAP